MYNITVVYTNFSLTPKEALEYKPYTFICGLPEDILNVGDKIISPDYKTPMQVIKIEYDNVVDHIRDIRLKHIYISNINGDEIINIRELNNYTNPEQSDLKTPKQSNKREKKSLLSSLMNKYKSQFLMMMMQMMGSNMNFPGISNNKE